MNSFFAEPLVRVGLCENAPFGLYPQGKYCVNASDAMITYQPLENDASMLVKGLEIGRDFHWQQKRDLCFAGVIQLHKSGQETLLLNIIKAEQYLESVVGSEMHPEAPIEFVKAHAIIARSWLMRQLTASKKTSKANREHGGDNILTWTQANAHTKYDICNDDHCQRYQGLDAVTECSRRAIEQTRGVVLLDIHHEIADTRYSKCCGGRTEIFSTCWDDVDFHYLSSVEDPYCHPHRLASALEKHPNLLKDYDKKTCDYYEWQATISAKQIRENLQERFNADVGEILDLIPVERGLSGRIKLLKIVGDKSQITVGKELAIRRLLAPTHLYSSCFDITRQSDNSFLLTGKGWGHGVGLCQIGAAVMSVEGYTYKQILEQYFPGTKCAAIY